MKNKKLLTALYIILMLLPLIAVVVAYPFLPDKIPAHYGMNNQVTRWGNKSETFMRMIPLNRTERRNRNMKRKLSY